VTEVVADTDVDRPPSSAYPTATETDVMLAVAFAVSLRFMPPEDVEPPAAILVGGVGFASAEPFPRVNRMVLINAADRPPVSVIVKEVR
jgi:hypothetical protein